MLGQYDPGYIEDALRAAPAEPPFPPTTDRAAWGSVRARLGHDAVQALIALGDAAARTSIPALPATLFLQCERTGERATYERPYLARREALGALVVAECLENRGRLLDPILDRAWAICEESTWEYPAHLRGLPIVEHPGIDLGVAMTALELAECEHLVGSVVEPALRARIRAEIDRRCFTPFLSRDDFWWLHISDAFREKAATNWTAVCAAGVVGSALYLERDLNRLSEMIARGIRALGLYLDAFDEDGGTSEGPEYWDYGFFYYTILAHLLEWRTGGRVRLLDGERIARIARFPLHTALSPGHFANFADAVDHGLHTSLLAYLARWLAIPQLMTLAKSQPPGLLPDATPDLTYGLRHLFWTVDSQAPPLTLARHDYLRGLQWMVARATPDDPTGLVLAAKGGHNDEIHNHNDLGTFIVHLGGESVVADLGPEQYTRDYFGPRRYEFLATSSRGHSVPLINGHEQGTGRQYAARGLAHQAEQEQDLLALDLTAAYPAAADLTALRRTLVLHRDETRGWVALEDVVEFASGPGMLESVLITLGQVQVDRDHALIQGEREAVRLRYDPEEVDVRIDLVPNVNLARDDAHPIEPPRTVTRILIALRQPAQRATIRLRLEPV